jgi:hypothetical protein
MKLSFKEFMSKDQPKSTTDLRNDGMTIDFEGEDSKNKPPIKSKKISGLNPDKMYGKRKKNELP